MADEPNIDVVAVGASAGGIEALQRVVSALPPSFPAAVLVVVHVAASSDSVLPRILSRAGPLEAVHPVDGERLRRSRIYVAPPDRHLVVLGDRLGLSRGARENGHRPAVNVLFRTAARAFGPRMAAVVLSGTLDDGAAGMEMVKSMGGLALVQDPADAAHPDMPRRALERVSADHVAAADALGEVLVSLAGGGRKEAGLVQPAGSGGEREQIAPEPDPALVPGVTYSCPDCGGVLKVDDDDGVLRCRVGHGWGGLSLMAAQSQRLEEALWVALRTLEERAQLATSMAAGARERSHHFTAQRFREQAEASDRLARTVRDLIEARALDAAMADEEHGTPGVEAAG